MAFELVKFQRWRFKNEDLERLQDRLDDFFDQLYSSDFYAALYSGEMAIGELLENVSVTTGTPAAISHNLRRIPKGVLLAKSTVQLDIWQPTAATSTQIHVQASANATVNLWVF